MSGFVLKMKKTTPTMLQLPMDDSSYSLNCNVCKSSAFFIKEFSLGEWGGGGGKIGKKAERKI